MSLPNVPATTSGESVAQPAFVPSPNPQPQDAKASTTAALQQQAPKRQLLGMEIDALTMEGAVDQLWAWINDGPQTEGCRYVVTPNVDHAVLLEKNVDLQAAYRDAHMVLADGFPIVMASKLLNQPVPERVAGSELVPRLFDFFNHYGDPVGVYSPPMGFENDKVECANILTRIAACKPKQELWVHRHHKLIDAKVALCVGATIDFLAGEQKRAPLWMQKHNLEWAHRMFSQPKRLVKRYAKDAWVFPQLVFRQWVANARASVAQEQQELKEENGTQQDGAR